MAEVDEALAAGAPMLLLDNMSVDELRDAVRHVGGRAKLEASGGVTLDTLRAVASTGVDFISVGAHHPQRPGARPVPAARADSMNLPMFGASDAPLLLENIPALQEEVRALASERGAVILAHNYQLPEIQDVADYVGDSLGLSQQAARAEGELIVFCGVHFMAETASILCPDKRVLIPDLDAGCSLADAITAEQLRVWKAAHPRRASS